MLVDQISQYDYLGMPETIEDICNGFEQTSGVALIGVFSEKLKPAFVTFTNTNYDQSFIATALCYVYSIFHEGAACANSVTCFDGKITRSRPKTLRK